MSKVALICLPFGLLFVTCVPGVLSTDRQIQRYFDMPGYVGPVPEHIRFAVLESTQLGSSRAEVDRFLHRRGIGTDGNSTCDLSGQDYLTCDISTRNHVWNLLREHCAIVFVFDSDRRLKNVQVQSRFEGPRL